MTAGRGLLPPRASRHGGFSLLEVLVAFSILALTLGVLMQLFSGSLRNTRVADAYARAADLAESKLAPVGPVVPPSGAAASGEEAGYRWRVDVAPYPVDDFAEPPAKLTAYRISARVEWTEGARDRALTLTSLRLEVPK